MTNIIGSVEQLLPRTFYWNLENKIVLNDSASERFTVYEDKYDYFFYIYEHDDYYWCINLCRPEFHVLEFDILVKVQYKEDSDDISRINFRMYEDKRKLNTVKKKGLLGVTCTFSNIRVIKRRLGESAPGGGNFADNQNDGNEENAETLDIVQSEKSSSIKFDNGRINSFTGNRKQHYRIMTERNSSKKNFRYSKLGNSEETSQSDTEDAQSLKFSKRQRLKRKAETVNESCLISDNENSGSVYKIQMKQTELFKKNRNSNNDSIFNYTNEIPQKKIEIKMSDFINDTSADNDPYITQFKQTCAFSKVDDNGPKLNEYSSKVNEEELYTVLDDVDDVNFDQETESDNDIDNNDEDGNQDDDDNSFTSSESEDDNTDDDSFPTRTIAAFFKELGPWTPPGLDPTSDSETSDEEWFPDENTDNEQIDNFKDLKFCEGAHHESFKSRSEDEEEETISFMYTGERVKTGGRYNVTSYKIVDKPKGLFALSRDLKDIFLNEEESDVILKVGDKKYPAHKVIIKARSPVFYAMLTNDTREKIQGFVDIPGCDPHIFKDFLLYLYTGHLDNISLENAKELYYMADKFEVDELGFDCVEFLYRNLNVDVFCDVLCLAEKHNEINLVEKATVFFIHNSEEILASENWQTFVKENPAKANEFYIKAYNRFPKVKVQES